MSDGGQGRPSYIIYLFIIDATIGEYNRVRREEQLKKYLHHQSITILPYFIGIVYCMGLYIIIQYCCYLNIEEFLVLFLVFKIFSMKCFYTRPMRFILSIF